jgi:hypothetical protein
MKVPNVPQVYDYQNLGTRDILKLLYAVFKRFAVLEYWNQKPVEYPTWLHTLERAASGRFTRLRRLKPYQFAQFPK